MPNSLEETFAAYLQMQMDAQKASASKETTQPEAQPSGVSREELTEAMKGFAAEVASAMQASFATIKQELAASIATEVEKAMPTRAAGAGRAGQEGGSEDPRETDLIGYLAKTPSDKLTQDDKVAKAKLTVMIAKGMSVSAQQLKA